jgi:hypothetical protein
MEDVDPVFGCWFHVYVHCTAIILSVRLQVDIIKMETLGIYGVRNTAHTYTVLMLALNFCESLN